MPFVLRALASIVVAIAAVVALATLAGTLAHVLGGIAVSVSVLTFTRAIMALAAEPGEQRQRSANPVEHG
jgi:hypothetical protein